MSEHTDGTRGGEFDVAIIGMAGRFPGADTLEEFWDNLRGGVESITHFTAEELEAAGITRAMLERPDYVRSLGRLRDVRHFDAAFFGYSPREAEILEPAHRVFLECAWEALEDAGVDPARFEGAVAVYAGAGNTGYADRNVRANPAAHAAAGDLAVTLGSGKDFVATRASYKLDLRGPSMTVQTGCSTALVATHVAAQSLLRGECDLALAGGSSIFIPQEGGYMYAPGSIQSPDGHCRAFDARAAGTVPGSGTGVVVLKRLEDALADGDAIRAVIRGSAINNDGAAKVAYTAPGVDGQASVIGEAMSLAGVGPDEVDYVEAHGSGTELGDVIEMAALTRAFRAGTERAGYCAVGAVKTNIGHLDTAAGAAGLIKTVLAMENGVIPPTLHFDTPNPQISLPGSPFFVPTRAMEWETKGGRPRIAGVSSFGIGGTNAHVVLEQAPQPAASGPSRPWQLLTLSARTPASLQAAAERLAAHLEKHPDLPLADVAFTLHEGRRAFGHRRAVVVRDGEDAAALLRGAAPERVATGEAESGAAPSVVFMFSGLGDHYPNMARGLYESEPVFRGEIDRCAELLRHILGADLRELLFHGDAPSDEAATGGIDLRRMLAKEEASPQAERLARTALAQPAVFAVDYALARLWMSWGIVPEAVIGHSLGEYAAACVAGILSLEDALLLVAERAKLIDALPAGAMLAVPLDASAAQPFLSPEVSIATVNAPGLSVVSGPVEAIADVEAKLSAAGHVARRLATTHAFHSPMMAPAAEPLAALAGRARLRPPSIPMVSNVTGTWITDAEATDPGYWTRHLLGTVRFAEGVGELLREGGRVFLEVGPGQTLATFVRQRPADEPNRPVAVVPSVRYAYDRKPDQAFLLEALGKLWLAGVVVDWKAFRGDERRRKARLPTYAWDRQLYWVEPARRDALAAGAVAYGKLVDPAEWTYVPTWERQRPPAASAEEAGSVLVLSDGSEFLEMVTRVLAATGARVTVARAGDAFAEDGDGFVLRPGAREDFAALAEALGGDRPARVVHAWSDPVSLLLLAEAFGHGAPAEVVVLTRGAHEVTGEEGALDSAAAARVGASRVVPQEYRALACRVVDVAGDGEVLAARVAADLLSGDAEPVAAWRGRHRWVRRFRAAKPARAAAALKEGGAYLLVGGLEGRNASLAEAVARTPGARVALVARQVDPRLAEALRARGGEVLALEADPADGAALAAALAEAEARFGAIDGVLHSTAFEEIGAMAAIGEADPAAWSAQLDRVRAGLEALEGAIGERRPGFVLLESSLAGVLGLPGRVRVAMANAVVDAWAAARSGDGVAWTAVDWDRGHGAAVAHVGGDELGIEADEVPAALARVLALAGEPQVLVSTAPLEERARRAAAPPAPPQAAAQANTYARPELPSSYAGAETEVEERLVEMWQSLLGITPIGVHDDFFGMGGHSLFATQIISRVREQFEIDLPLKAIFEAPTIARFGALIEEAIIAEIESLSDEEAMSLAGQ